MTDTVTELFGEEQLGDKLRAAFRHWNDMRGDRLMPDRREMNPVEMRHALPRVWIYEREADNDYRCRIAGEEINAAFGRPIQGHRARDVIGPRYDKFVRARWDYVLDHATLFHGHTARTHATQTTERLCLPLADSSGTPRFVFGVSQYFDSVAPKFYQDSFNFISVDVTFYRIPTFERIVDGAPA